MDIDIVNAVLRLCVEQQTCLFEVPLLCDYCLEQRLCTNAKYVLASIKNYMEIFKISRDQNRIELFMPFELCRNYSINGQCQFNGTNGESCRHLHVCYDYFSSGSCRRATNCPYPHALTKNFHEAILGALVNLDLDALSKAFRVYCHSKKNLLNYNSSGMLSSRLQQQPPVPSSSSTNNSTPSSSINSNWRSITAAPHISGTTSWRATNRTMLASKIISTPPPTPPPEKGLQIRWSPQTDIQSHFIEVVFSNQTKCDGGPMRTHNVYKHFGVAQVFYQNSETTDRVVLHGPVTFQSFTFTPRILRRTVDMRHVCFANMPIETNRIALYIDTVSSPYKQNNFDYYLNDKQTIVVEYNEDIDFAKISSNVRSRPECNGLPIKCIQLYHPETLLIEYDTERSEDDIKQLFKDERIFHIKTYSYCAFVHFYCHDDLARSIKTTFDEPIRMTPIYIDIYSQRHFDEYLQRRQIEIQAKPVIAPVSPAQNIPIQSANNKKKCQPVPEVDGSTEVQQEPKEEKIEPVPVLPTPPSPRSEILTAIEEKPSVVVSKPTKREIRPTATPPPVNKDRTVARKDSAKQASSQSRKQQPPPPPPPPPVAVQPMVNGDNNDDEEETVASDDDFQDLPSDFDDDDLFLDSSTDNNGDMEFLRSAAKNLMSSLAEMEAASANTNTIDAPHSLLYGDDYIVTIKSRRFALAFLDYTQFRVEKQRNPDKFRLLASLKRDVSSSSSKKATMDIERFLRDRTPSPSRQELPVLIEPESSSTVVPTETKSAKKRRKRNKKKKNANNNGQDKSAPTPESDNGEDDEDTTVHVLNDQGLDQIDFPAQRLPHVFLGNDLKPCIVVAGDEHGDENGHGGDNSEHEEWQDVTSGGKPVPVSKRSQKKKPTPQKPEPAKTEVVEQHSIASAPSSTVIRSSPLATEHNSVIIPPICRGFVHNPKSFETFRLRLRRAFPSTNIHFASDTYTIIVDGSSKLTVQQCLTYLDSLPSHKHSLLLAFDQFPPTTASIVMRMQQSTAQIQLDRHANYNRIFRSSYRLIDFQLKQHFNQQQCIYCRRSKKQFCITYLEFASEKQSTNELDDAIRQRVLQMFNTRFTYMAIALSPDLMTTKRWSLFYKNLCEHKDINKTVLMRTIGSIVQLYGLHAHVQQMQTMLTKFLDANRYETDIIESEQASGLFMLFKRDFHEMEMLENFQEAELRFVYRRHRRLLFVQCFQDKLELVKGRVQKMRSQLSTMILPVKSLALSRYYSTSNEIERIAAASSCIITIEKRHDHHNRSDEYLINLKLVGRSTDNTNKAVRLFKEFEEHKYSTRKIYNTEINSFTTANIETLKNECLTSHVSCVVDQSNGCIELEGLSEDFVQIEKIISDLCTVIARQALDDVQLAMQWVYYDPSTNKPLAFGETIKRQLEACYAKKQKGVVNFKDHTGHIRTFDMDKMIELVHNNGNNAHAMTSVKIERNDPKNPHAVQLPSHWTPMTTPWTRVFLVRRENMIEWKANTEIQKLLKLPYMLPEDWIIEIYRVQNPRMFQQYCVHKNNFAARSQDFERTLYRLAQANLVDDVCANGFNRSHTDSAYSAYGHGCHFYRKASDIDRTATLLEQNLQTTPMLLQQQPPIKQSIRFLFVCKVLVGRYTRGDATIKTCPPGYDSTVDNIASPEIFVTHHDAQVLPEYLIAYQSAIF